MQIYSVWHQLKGLLYFNISLSSTSHSTGAKLTQTTQSKGSYIIIPNPPSYSLPLSCTDLKASSHKREHHRAGSVPGTWRPLLTLDTGLPSFSHVRIGAGMPLASHSSLTALLTTTVTMSLLPEMDGGTEKKNPQKKGCNSYIRVLITMKWNRLHSFGCYFSFLMLFLLNSCNVFALCQILLFPSMSGQITAVKLLWARYVGLGPQPRGQLWNPGTTP